MTKANLGPTELYFVFCVYVNGHKKINKFSDRTFIFYFSFSSFFGF